MGDEVVVVTQPGEVDGDPLSEVVSDMVEGLVLVPLAPPHKGDSGHKGHKVLDSAMCQ